jgi:hypothetical protein
MRFRHLFTRSRSTPVSGSEMAALAASITGVTGSSFVWCACGRPLMPVVIENEGQIEVASLACPPCRGAVPVWSGVLMTAPAAEAPAHG